ncbi:MAG: trypsin-like peptidase domain-containing protein [Silvibacterium sp.]
MSPSTKKGIAKVSAANSLGQQTRGTGFLVSDSIVITAWHVVENAATIDLDFQGFRTTARIIARHSDIAALRCSSPVPTTPLPIGDLLAADQCWETFGFPAFNPGGVALAGAIRYFDSSQDSSPIQLFCEELAAGAGAGVPGLSGAPCIVDGSVVGVINEAIIDSYGASQAGTIYARQVGSLIEQLEGLVRLPDPLRRGLPGLPRQELPNVPFRFIEHYGPEHAEVFFGRSRDIAVVYSQISDPETPVIQLLYGQTGVGKSSLIAAGLVPRLKAFHEVRLSSRTDFPTLLATIERALDAAGDKLGDAWRSVEADGRPLVVFIDQVEESFTRGQRAEEEWVRFLEALGPLLRPPDRVGGKAVLSFRKEWLAEIIDKLNTSNLPYQQTLLNRLDPEGVREVVTGLTRTHRLSRRYRLTIEPELDVTIRNAILNDLESSAAPALQILMTRMWLEACQTDPNAPKFDHNLFLRVTQQKGLFLDAFLDTQLREIAQTDLDLVQSGLAFDILYFCTTGTGTSEARKEEELFREYRHLPHARVTAAVGLLKDHKLLGDIHDGNGARLMHDALGPFVHDRFHHSPAPGQRARRILESKATGWSGPAVSGDLIDSVDLRTIEIGSSGMRARTEAEERAVRASKKEADRQQLLLRTRYAFLGVFIIAALIAGTLFYMQYSERASLEIREKGDAAALIAGIPGRGEDGSQLAIQAIEKAGRDKLLNYPQVLQALTLGVSGLSETRALCCDPSNNVNAVDFSADGEVIATAGGDRSIRLWNAATGQPIDSWEAPDSRCKCVFGLAFSSQGGMLASVPLSGTPSMWGIGEKPIRQIPLKDNLGADSHGWYESVRFAHKHPWLAAAGFGQSNKTGRVTVWNADGEQMFSREFDKEATFAEFSPSDQQIAVSFITGEIRIFNADLSDSSKPPLDHKGPLPLANVFFSPDGESLVSSPRYSDNKVVVWNLDTGRPRCVLANDEAQIDHGWDTTIVRERSLGPTGAIFSPKGDELLVSTWEHQLLRVDAQACFVKERLAGHTGSVYSVRFSPDAEHFATAGWGDGTARVWHFGSGPAILPLIKAPARITSAAFSPHGDELLTGTSRGSVIAWDAQSAKELGHSQSHSTEVFAIRFSQDGATLLTASRYGPVTIRRGDKVSHLPVDGWVWDVSLSSDGARAIVLTQSRTAVEWDVRGDVPKLLGVCCQLAEGQYIDKLAFSRSDPRVLATIVGGQITARINIWDRSANETWNIRKLKDMRGIGNGSVRSFSNDGRFLVTAWSDQKARVFDTKTGEMTILEGHQNEVHSAAFSTRGYALATGSVDGTIRLWDRYQDGFSTWGIIRTGDPVEEVDFNRDGTRLLARGMDGIVRIYDATPDAFLKLGCRNLRYSKHFEPVKDFCSPYLADNSGDK